MKHFLEKMRSPDWVWAEQYEPTEQKDETLLMQDSIVFFVDNGTESMLLCSYACCFVVAGSLFIVNTLTLWNRVLLEDVMVTQLL
jgi:hypothetical protein